MTVNPTHEKRELPRLLCDHRFSQVILSFPHMQMDAEAINFNYSGIGIFSVDRLPEEYRCTISFRYIHNQKNFDFQHIPSVVIYKNETEVGCQAGIKFSTDEFDTATMTRLQALHEIVQAHQLNGRYGL